jgi:hypothetical protein
MRSRRNADEDPCCAEASGAKRETEARATRSETPAVQRLAEGQRILVDILSISEQIGILQRNVYFGKGDVMADTIFWWTVGKGKGNEKAGELREKLMKVAIKDCRGKKLDETVVMIDNKTRAGDFRDAVQGLGDDEKKMLKRVGSAEPEGKDGLKIERLVGKAPAQPNYSDEE